MSYGLKNQQFTSSEGENPVVPSPRTVSVNTHAVQVGRAENSMGKGEVAAF